MHNWYACSHARPTYCNVCREALSGVTSHGLSCEVCKFKAHKRCAVRATNNCKWTTLASIGKDIIEDEDGVRQGTADPLASSPGGLTRLLGTLPLGFPLLLLCTWGLCGGLRASELCPGPVIMLCLGQDRGWDSSVPPLPVWRSVLVEVILEHLCPRPSVPRAWGAATCPRVSAWSADRHASPVAGRKPARECQVHGV